MTRPPGESEFDEPEVTPDESRSRWRRRSSPAAVGPTDVADEVKAVLRAAFDVPDQEPELRWAPDPEDGRSAVRTAGVSDGPALRNGEVRESRFESVSASSSADDTGPFDPFEGPPTRGEDTTKWRRSRRRFRDIALDHDTRIKAKAEAKTQATEVAEGVSEPEFKVTEEGKKRVVITDEEVLKVKRSAPKEERSRKKIRRRSSDEVTRLPSRRWWSRTADGRWRLRWYSVVGVICVAAVLVLLLLTSPLLSIRNIEVEGNVYADQARLDEVVGQLKGDAILTADLHGATLQIEAIPWVRKARISMHLPSRVVVQIDERRPEAFFRAGDGYIRVIDGEGRVLDVIEGDPVDYVRIIGAGPNLAPGDFVGQPFLGAVELIGALPASLADRLVSATVSPEGEISLQLEPNLLVIFGQPSDFQVKLVAVVNEIKRQGSRSYTVIDVSTGEPNVR